MQKIDTPCPECGRMPVHRFDLAGGHIWNCPACGHQEITAGVDIEAQLNELANHDPELADRWRRELKI